jgi:hypothetical protein
MSTHPVNLAPRFVLELTALFAPGYWGWTQHEGILRIVLAFAVPLAAAAVVPTVSVCYLFGSQERLTPNSCLFSPATVLPQPNGARRMAR